MHSASFITGINGFVGRHLASHLVSHNRRVSGIDVQERSFSSDIDYVQADIRDVDEVTRILKKTKPGEIYHLAGISSPSKFNDDQYSCFQINVMGSIALLDAMKNACPNSVLLMVGSSRQYKSPDSSEPIPETAEQAPLSFYGLSKYIAEIIGRRYVHSYKLDIRYTRSFNHTGPGQSPKFVCSEWARQIALIEAQGANPMISIGNINKTVDFTDVREVVEAYRLIVEKGKIGEAYNVCSGRGIELNFILNYLKAKSSKAVSVNTSQEKKVNDDSEKWIIGDNRKIHEATGWSPNFPIVKTVDDLYAWWLDRLAQPNV